MDDRSGAGRPGLRYTPPATPVDRIARRHKIFEPVVLDIAGGEVRAHILNVSTSGALLHATAAVPAPGQGVVVTLCGRRMQARVAWVEGSRFGIAFLGAMRADEIDKLLG